MITLYLVRHGETTYNAEGRVQGHHDPPLTGLGVRQAEAAADRLSGEQIKAVISSDLRRAAGTAQIVAARHSLNVETTPLLREANLGVFQGLTAKEIAEKFPRELNDWRRDPASLRPPGGETIEDVVARCRAFLSTLQIDDEQRSGVVIVGHGGSLRGLVVAALQLPLETYHKLHFSNGGISIIVLGPRTELRLLNDTCHLRSLACADTDSDSGA